MAANTHYSKGDAELEEITAKWPSVEGVTFTLDFIRAPVEEVKKMRRETPPKITTVISEDFNIPVTDGEIMLRKYIPKDSEGPFPLLAWYHGGGYTIGHPDMDDEFCRLACVTHNLVIVSVDYRLAPEFPFPTGFEDSYAALKWCATHAKDLKVDLAKGFLVGGESAGGNFSAGLTIRARDDPEFTAKLTGQVLSVPNVVTDDCYPEKYKDQLLSYGEIQDAPIVPRKAIDFFMSCYGCKDGSDPRRSPLVASSHANLPRAVIQVGGNDPLRDEGILYSKVLQESGVETKLLIYPGGFHAFHVFAAEAKLAIKYRQDMQDGIKWLLSG